MRNNAKALGTTAGSYAKMTDLATISDMMFLINIETNTRGMMINLIQYSKNRKRET